MKLKHTWMMVMALACMGPLSLAMAQPVGDGFAGRMDQYLVDAARLPADRVSLVPARGMKGKKALRVAKEASAQFIDIPVDERTKYMLTLNARFDGGESAEENPHFLRFASPGGARPVVSTRELIFLNEQKVPIHTTRIGLPYRESTPYTDVFYPPAKAKFLRLRFTAAMDDVVLFVDDIKLAKAPDEGAINANPVLGKYGPQDYSGWLNFANGASMVTLPDGTIAMDTKYGTTGMTFPISEPGAYELSVISESNGYNYSFLLRFVDENNKSTGQVSAWGHGRPIRFNLPPNTVRGQFLVYSSILKEARVVRAEKQ